MEAEVSPTEAADERERRHYLRLDRSHPEGVPEENPRGRALDFDFEIEADTAELPANRHQSSFKTKMEDIGKACIIDDRRFEKY